MMDDERIVYQALEPGVHLPYKQGVDGSNPPSPTPSWGCFGFDSVDVGR